MNHIVVGEIYRTTKHRSGTSKSGDWELFTILDERNRNEVTVFANNLPNKGYDGCQIKILSITEVKNGAKKGKDEKWYQVVSMNADVDVLESDLKSDGDPFEDLDGDDGKLPWKELDI
jgi:hypothetical protein